MYKSQRTKRSMLLRLITGNDFSEAKFSNCCRSNFQLRAHPQDVIRLLLLRGGIRILVINCRIVPLALYAGIRPCLSRGREFREAVCSENCAVLFLPVRKLQAAGLLNRTLSVFGSRFRVSTISIAKASSLRRDGCGGVGAGVSCRSGSCSAIDSFIFCSSVFVSPNVESKADRVA
jgi:hypothetical protein